MDEFEVVELTAEDGAALFDEVARREMGMSGAEFLRRWRAGEWAGRDLDEVPGLVSVWLYLPFADRSDFQESDEPAEDVKAAFEAGDRFTTEG